MNPIELKRNIIWSIYLRLRDTEGPDANKEIFGPKSCDYV